MGLNNEKNKPHVLLLLLIVIVSIAGKPSAVAGRALPLISPQGYSKILATLGVVCQCCDGIDGACSSTWTDSCSNLQCSPWKSHS